MQQTQPPGTSLRMQLAQSDRSAPSTPSVPNSFTTTAIRSRSARRARRSFTAVVLPHPQEPREYVDGDLHAPILENFVPPRSASLKIRADVHHAALARGSKKPARARAPERFADAEELYGIENWGKGFFSVSDDGNLLVHPTRERRPLRRPQGRRRRRRPPRDLDARSSSASRRSSTSAVKELNEAFAPGDQGVRLRRRLPRRLPDQGQPEEGRRPRDHRGGPQVRLRPRGGSKPELIAALSQDLGSDCLITTNGYKDEAFIRLALNGVRMGKKVILILEKVSELERILDVAKKRGVRPLIGMRAKLYARGSGKWAKSGGEAAKFGLTTTEMLEAVEILKSPQDARLARHAPLPHRLADHRHPEDQGRDQGGGPRLREAPRARASRSST